MSGVLDALLMARYTDGPHMEVWRIIGPVAIASRFFSTRTRGASNRDKKPNRMVRFVKRAIPLSIAYFGTCFNSPSASPLTLALLLIEKGLYEFQSTVGLISALYVRAIIGVHIGAKLPYHLGILSSIIFKRAYFNLFGLLIDYTVLKLPWPGQN